MDDAIETRRAVEADAQAILALTRAAYAKWVPVIGREPKPMTADYHAALRHHRIDLLVVNGGLVGLLETIPGANHLLIENVAVSPRHQGRGLGRRLLADADRLAESLGFGEIRVYTNKLFTVNIAFYTGLGYGVEREESSLGGTVVHMRKAVDRAECAH